MSKNVANNVANEKVQDYVKKSHNMTENEQKSEKTAQDVQKNCLSLTELKDGAFYYTINGIEEAHFCEVNGVPELVMPELVEVLAPVPSYDLFVELTEKDKENTKLKELLSKCVSRVDTLSDILDFLKDKVVYKQSKQLADMLKSTREIIKKIDEVLK